MRGVVKIAALYVGAVALGTAANLLSPPSPTDPVYQRGIGALSAVDLTTPAADAENDWPHYANDLAGTRFSALSQITPANVRSLEVAWRAPIGNGIKRSMEVTPLKIEDALYACTANNDVVSIDAETGKILWRFRSQISVERRHSTNCRGVGYFRVPGACGVCAERVITNTIDARLIALDRFTGAPCPGFGEDGKVDLTVGMGRVDRGYYFVSSAPTVVDGKVILGGWVTDGQYWGEPSGVIRAFDASTGD